MVRVCIATLADAQAILNIYTPYILNTAVTFENEVPSLKEFEGRIQHYSEKFPWIVCEVDGIIAGYVYASLYRDRDAYQWTCECSVYLHPNFHGKGIAKQLYQALFSILKLQGMVNLYAVITLPNQASVTLHESCGFTYFATYDNVGYKFDEWHKVGWWQLQLNDYQLKPPPPIKFSDLSSSVYAKILQQAENAISVKFTG